MLFYRLAVPSLNHQPPLFRLPGTLQGSEIQHPDLQHHSMLIHMSVEQFFSLEFAQLPSQKHKAISAFSVSLAVHSVQGRHKQQELRKMQRVSLPAPQSLLEHSLDKSPTPQPQSGFLTRLPLDIRFLIYELILPNVIRIRTRTKRNKKLGHALEYIGCREPKTGGGVTKHFCDVCLMRHSDSLVHTDLILGGFLTSGNQM